MWNPGVVSRWFRCGVGIAVLLLAAHPAHASLILLYPTPAASQVGNLVVNGSFELGTPCGFWATGTTDTPFALPNGWSSAGASQNYASWCHDSYPSGPPWRFFGSDWLPDGDYALYFGNSFFTSSLTPQFNTTTGEVTFSGTPTFTPTYGAPVRLWQVIPTASNPAPAYQLNFWTSGEAASAGQYFDDGVFGLRLTNVLPGDPIVYLTVPSFYHLAGPSRRYAFKFVPLNPNVDVTVEFVNWGHLGGVGMDRTELVLDDVIVTALDSAVDHFTCYKVARSSKTAKFPPISGVTLRDQFGLSTVTVERPLTLCAPTDKKNEDPTAPSHPDHLKAYRVRNEVESALPKNVQVTNQFPTIHVDLIKPTHILVPTLKSLSPPPPPPPVSPAVDHFQCYKVRLTKGTQKFPSQLGVTVADQFGGMLVAVTKPTALCAPVDKNGEEPGAETHAVHLMCYRIERAPGGPKFETIRRVLVTNQFGQETLDVKKPLQLCVPSSKTL